MNPYAYMECPFCPHRVAPHAWVSHVAVEHPRELDRVVTKLREGVEEFR